MTVRSTVPSGSSSPASGGIARYAHQAAVAQRRPELGILAHDRDRVVELLGARQRLARARRHRGLAVTVQRNVEQQRALGGVVVDRGAHGARGHRLVGRVERLERDEPRLRAVQLGTHRVVLERRPRRLLEPVGVRPPRLDRDVQLAGHANDPLATVAVRSSGGPIFDSAAAASEHARTR